MGLIQRANDLILGERIPAPANVPKNSLPEGVVLRRGTIVPWLGGLFARMGRPAAAVTLGRTIVVDPAARLTPELLAHELVHVRQWREVRLFPIRYALATLRHGYHSNPYEVEARVASESPRASNSGEHLS